MIWLTLIKNEFAKKELRLFILEIALKNKKKDYLVTFSKNAKIIYELVNKNHLFLFYNKSVVEI